MVIGKSYIPYRRFWTSRQISAIFVFIVLLLTGLKWLQYVVTVLITNQGIDDCVEIGYFALLTSAMFLFVIYRRKPI